MDVTMGQLRALRELERCGTMAAAAASLGYTTGAVSQQLANLEKATGTALTARTGRRVQLTRGGMIMAEHAELVLQAVADARRALDTEKQEVAGTVRVGTFATTAAALLVPTIAKALARYPKLAVTSREFSVDGTAAAVRDGEVDLALGIDYPHAPMPREPQTEIVRLHTERFGLAVADTLRSPCAVSLESVREWQWILPPKDTQYARAVYAACRLSGFEPRVVHEVTDTRTSLELAAQGLGVTPLTSLMEDLLRPRGLCRIELEDRVERHIVLVRRAQPVQPVAITALTDLFAEVVREARDR
ncbi:LysR family transcriptional regulator [Nocardiopsis suaedae]|uniref:LysR substrate-binding domain-containing protein n=1 Tax=Nocardiopsis suaedae TaxID=3018444 RepID=A0ABT4THK0_9ACTN|nr:LysR substrate-binding domain-containing protein [Nocardiopsis suaedae]MDA2804188.1 LysR substrate-binding domain-containing protein [Nocardiopsis suaedae]